MPHWVVPDAEMSGAAVQNFLQGREWDVDDPTTEYPRLYPDIPFEPTEQWLTDNASAITPYEEEPSPSPFEGMRAEASWTPPEPEPERPRAAAELTYEERPRAAAELTYDEPPPEDRVRESVRALADDWEREQEDETVQRAGGWTPPEGSPLGNIRDPWWQEFEDEWLKQIREHPNSPDFREKIEPNLGPRGWSEEFRGMPEHGSSRHGNDLTWDETRRLGDSLVRWGWPDSRPEVGEASNVVGHVTSDVASRAEHIGPRLGRINPRELARNLASRVNAFAPTGTGSSMAEMDPQQLLLRVIEQELQPQIRDPRDINRGPPIPTTNPFEGARGDASLAPDQTAPMDAETLAGGGRFTDESMLAWDAAQRERDVEDLRIREEMRARVAARIAEGQASGRGLLGPTEMRATRGRDLIDPAGYVRDLAAGRAPVQQIEAPDWVPPNLRPQVKGALQLGQLAGELTTGIRQATQTPEVIEAEESMRGRLADQLGNLPFVGKPLQAVAETVPGLRDMTLTPGDWAEGIVSGMIGPPGTGPTARTLTGAQQSKRMANLIRRNEILSKIQPPAKSGPSIGEWIETQLSDRLAPINRAGPRSEVEVGLMRGFGGEAQAIIHDFIEPVVREAGDYLEDFNTFSRIVRDLEIMALPKFEGMERLYVSGIENADDARRMIQELGQKVGQDGRLRVWQAHQAMGEAVQRLRDDLLDGGIITQEAYDELVKQPNYYPIRFIEASDAIGAVGRTGQKMESTTNTLRRLSEAGSDAASLQPIHTFTYGMIEGYHQIWANRVATTYVDDMMEKGGAGLRKIPSTQIERGVQIEPRPVKDPANLTQHDIAAIVRPIRYKDLHENQIVRRVEGVPEYFEVDDLGAAAIIKGYDQQILDAGWLTVRGIWTALGQTQRLGATILSPAFAVVNPVADTLWRTFRMGKDAFKNLPQGFAAALTHNEDYWDYMRSGAAMSGMFAETPDDLVRELQRANSTPKLRAMIRDTGGQQARNPKELFALLSPKGLAKYFDLDLGPQAFAQRMAADAVMALAWGGGAYAVIPEDDPDRLAKAAGVGLAAAAGRRGIVRANQVMEDTSRIATRMTELGRAPEAIAKRANIRIPEGRSLQRNIPNRPPTASRPPSQVQRIEEPGVEPGSPSKPHGLYTSPAGLPSPHADLGGDVTRYFVNPKARTLTVDMDQSPVIRRGAVGSSSGVVALKQLSGDGEWARLAAMSKSELIAELSRKEPRVDWSSYFDKQELLEAYGARVAREHGYDSIWGYDKADPSFSEFVALNDKAFYDPSASMSEGLAAMMGRRGSADFARGGSFTKAIDPLFPFTNVGTTGFLDVFRALRYDPNARIRAGALVGIQSALTAYNLQDPAYADVPWWEKMSHLIIMLPGSEPKPDGSGYEKIKRISLPIRDLGMFTGTVGYAVEKAWREEPTQINDFLTMLQSYSPGVAGIALGERLPAVAGVPLQLATNRNFFTGGKIISDRLEQFSPQERSYATTRQDPLTGKVTEVARRTSALSESPAARAIQTNEIPVIGDRIRDMLGDSPAEMDFAIRGYAGGLGQTAMDISNVLAGRPTDAAPVVGGMTRQLLRTYGDQRREDRYDRMAEELRRRERGVAEYVKGTPEYLEADDPSVRDALLVKAKNTLETNLRIKYDLVTRPRGQPARYLDLETGDPVTSAREEARIDQARQIFNELKAGSIEWEDIPRSLVPYVELYGGLDGKRIYTDNYLEWMAGNRERQPGQAQQRRTIQGQVLSE